MCPRTAYIPLHGPGAGQQVRTYGFRSIAHDINSSVLQTASGWNRYDHDLLYAIAHSRETLRVSISNRHGRETPKHVLKSRTRTPLNALIYQHSRRTIFAQFPDPSAVDEEQQRHWKQGYAQKPVQLLAESSSECCQEVIDSPKQARSPIHSECVEHVGRKHRKPST